MAPTGGCSGVGAATALVLIAWMVAWVEGVRAAGPGTSCVTSAECDDGDVCNGYEFCDSGGFCAPGTAMLCCGAVPQYCNQAFAACDEFSANAGAACTSDDDCVCGRCDYCRRDCRVRVCDAASVNAGAVCLTDPHCLGGACPAPDESCDDALPANGPETCNQATGVCERSVSMHASRQTIAHLDAPINSTLDGDGGQTNRARSVTAAVTECVAGYCQPWDGDTRPSRLTYADLDYDSGLLAADDFVAGAELTEIGRLCVWGAYTDSDTIVPEFDCGLDVASDNFRVRILGNSPYDLPDRDVVLGTSSAIAVRTSAAFDAYWHYELTLTEPIAGFMPGETYWLEVANRIIEPEGCIWNWAGAAYLSPFNNYSARGSDANGYPAGSFHLIDRAFCIEGEAESPLTPVRRCYECDGTCRVGPVGCCLPQQCWEGIDYLGVDSKGNPLSCENESPCPLRPPNDDIADAQLVSVGKHPFTTMCAMTDGWNPIPTPHWDFDIVHDVWFHFVATQDCTVRFDTCVSNCITDLAMAVYSDGTGNCVDPVDEATAEATMLEAVDDNCTAASMLCGGGFLEFPADVGQCFTVRIGIYAEAGWSVYTGKQWLDISCGEPICGDGAAQASLGEECDGADDSLCTGSCYPPGHAEACQCGPVSVCGNGIVEEGEICDGPEDDACPDNCRPPGTLQECTCGGECGDGIRQPSELCDGDDDDLCPGDCRPPGDPDGPCTCDATCGNNVVEVGEACDGPADFNCAGLCLPDCTCPLPVCGNSVVESGEECDGTGAGQCTESACRLPGDPLGGCTCACYDICPDIPATPASPERNRFISIAPPTDLTHSHALRVKLTSLHHPPEPPNAPDFSAFEGQYRYVNTFRDGNDQAVLLCLDAGGSPYPCARLGCEPEYRHWAVDFAGAPVIQVTGAAVVASSTYEVDARLIGGGTPYPPSQCTTNVQTLLTARWGDVGSGGGGPPDGAANVIDIGIVVDKVKGLEGALPEFRALLQKNDPLPVTDSVNVIDIGLTTDAVKGLAYPYAGPAACP